MSAAGPSHTQVSAWGSDEHILNDSPPTSKEITVVSETVVQSEPWELKPTQHSPPKEWGHMPR